MAIQYFGAKLSGQVASDVTVATGASTGLDVELAVNLAGTSFNKQRTLDALEAIKCAVIEQITSSGE